MTDDSEITIDHTWYERPDGVPEAVTAGGVVARQDKNGRIWLAAAVEQHRHSHVLPKGHVEAGEELAEAAQREIKEEAGFTDLTLLTELGSKARLSFDRAEWKVTHYFLFLTGEVDVVPDEHWLHDPPQWFLLDDEPNLQWPEQNELVIEHRDTIRDHVVAAAQ